MRYSEYKPPRSSHKKRNGLLFVVSAVVLFGVIAAVYKTVFISVPTVEQKIENKLSFDMSVTSVESALIKSKITDQEIDLSLSSIASVSTLSSVTEINKILDVYVPVTSFNSVRQKIFNNDLADTIVTIPVGTDEIIKSAIAEVSGVTVEFMESGVGELSDTDIAFIPIELLDSSVKLLEYEGDYYLDSFKSGALFREAIFDDESASLFSDLKLNDLDDKQSVYKVNMTGVTALTRIMQRKLAAVGDPLYFSAKIGEFLADADLTHISNEVSFKPGCGYSNTLFCSPPEFIETLKASGVDLVELTGNHNNDLGSEFNTQSIETYRGLEWNTVGGGLNTVDAAKPFISDAKGSSIAFLAYNYPDSPNGGAISGAERAGANSFDLARIKTDIESAKQNSDFVIVDVQYWECYAYPDGYIEFPQCDKPIGEQEQNFKKIIDLGADMVIGSSAHQPQTYELYKGRAIYYGLGNLYFDQTSWPGTERGIILTHYFANGVLLQTKLTPTVYHADLQTRVMTDEESSYLLTRLHAAR